MKLFYSFFAFLVLFSSFAQAQNVKNLSHTKPGEQQEIKSTNHLKKDLEQKQLSESPERIADTTVTQHNGNTRKIKKCSRRMSNKSSRKK